MPSGISPWPRPSRIARWSLEPRRSAIATCSTRCRRPEYGARLIRQRLRSSNVALLFGSEKFGLSNDALSHCHWLIRIPTCDENISMNLGQAVAVCLYELIRDSKHERAAEQLKPATAEELERITTLLLEALQTSGFLDRRRVSDADERIRRLVRRLRLPERDAVIWLGMLRQMLWKMNQAKNLKLRISNSLNSQLSTLNSQL